jgi:hypothetical protein
MEKAYGRATQTSEQPKDFMDLSYKKEPWILESEVRWALDQLPYNKAPGVTTYK